MERDPSAAQAEYLGMFRTDIENYVDPERVRANVSKGIYERLPQSGITYFAATDPSGGSIDAFALCIAHTDRVQQKIVVDCLRNVKSPFQPSDVVAEFSQILRNYRLDRVTGDRYAGQWPAEAFGKHNISYVPAERSKSDAYVDMLPLLNAQRLDLLDNQQAVNQIIGLERRTTRGSGKDVVDQSPGQFDDLANGLLLLPAAMSSSAAMILHFLVFNRVFRISTLPIKSR